MRGLWRRGLSQAVVWLCLAAVLLALVPLALILFYVITQGISSLNWAFFTHLPAPVGETGGGMANGIVGSLIVTGIAATGAIPVGVVAGIYAAEYRGTRLASATRFAADTLNGVPSIVVGLFAYTVVVRLASGGTAPSGCGLQSQAPANGTGYTVYAAAFLFVMVPHAIITVSLFAFLWAWSDFVFASTLDQGGELQPITLGIYRYIGNNNQEWNAIMATAVVASIPATVLLLVAQRYVAAGITAGAVKD